MKLKKIPFRQNRKLQFAAVALAAMLLFLFGWKMEGKNLAAELSRDFSAIEAIKTEVAAVKSARNNYFRAIGKGNGGAYDRYQDAADCPANLDWRLISLKNLRNDLRRLLGEIGLREQEQEQRKWEQKIEIEEAKFLNDVAKMAEEVFDVEGLKAREAEARAMFEEDTINLVNCLETFRNWENCKEERVTFLETREYYLREIFEMKTDVDLSKIEAEEKLEEMLEEYNNPQTSGLINKIQPKLLKADSSESYTSTDYAVNDPAMTDAQAAKILNEEAAKADAVTGGAQKTADSTEDLKTAAEAAGSSEESSTTISGSGATAGLAVFKKYYEGNKYGSAIGMITGWTNFMLPFVGAIAIAALVYAGFLYLTAAGNEEQTGKARKIIIWVVIGIIIIFFAYAIVNTLLEGDSSGSGGGTSVDVSIGGIDFSYDD
ncbi:MAG: hypothetical protein ABIE14_05415 [Patescibacteria group bacterium]